MSESILFEKVFSHLERIYSGMSKDQIGCIVSEIIEILELKEKCEDSITSEKWSEKDVVAITYADTLKSEPEKPLITLKKFFDSYFKGTINSIHILPFFPYTSDDGFSVRGQHRPDFGQDHRSRPSTPGCQACALVP